jgi:hypothetical protein
MEVDLDETFTSTDSHSDELDELDESSAVYANEEQASARGRQLYAQEGDSSDEVDPRKLLRDPTLSEIRWYYRREMGGIICRKPIKDAFKNGFEFTGDNADRARELLEMPRYNRRKEYLDAHQMAEIKSRRDGFALLYIGTKDDTDGNHISPISNDVSVDEISHVKVLTIDDLADSGVIYDQVEEGTGLEQSQVEVRDTGIVVNKDLSDPDFGTPVGYVLDSNPAQFIHADRVVHYVWNEDVDGDYDHDGVARFHDSNTLGEWEGDSVLIPSYDLLKGLAKGNWSVMQALFRHASHMYDVELPSDANEEDLNTAVNVTRNINAKSALVLPNGYEVTQHESGNELDPTNHYDVIFDQLCANHEMTRSVLFGTQTGTVSGSETDIKNYFNKVERYRSNRAEDKINEYLTQAVKMIDGRTEDDYEFTAEFEWGPLFKLDREARLNVFQSHSQALQTLVGSYVMTPDEVRSVLSEEWSFIDVDDLTETQKDELDRIRLATSGQGEAAILSEKEYTEGPESASGEESAGRPEGAQQSSETSEATPNADSHVEDSNVSEDDSQETERSSDERHAKSDDFEVDTV